MMMIFWGYDVDDGSYLLLAFVFILNYKYICLAVFWMLLDERISIKC